MEFNSLSDEEFTRLAINQSRIHTVILQEWLKRFKISFPYMVNTSGEVVNCHLKEIVEDEHCDKLVLEQAIKIRKELLIK